MKRKYTEIDNEDLLPYAPSKRIKLTPVALIGRLWYTPALILPSLNLLIGRKTKTALAREAIEKNDLPLFQYCIDLQMDIFPQLLSQIVSRNRIEMMRDLINRGVPVDRPEQGGKSAFYFAVIGGRQKIARLLVEKGRADAQRKNGRGEHTFLHIAVIYGQTRSMATFLVKECKIDVNAKDKRGKTTLHFARGIDAKRLLISLGADVNLADIGGTTPLLVANIPIAVHF